MRGYIKYTLGIYLIIYLLTIPCIATQDPLPRTTLTELKISELTERISIKYKKTNKIVINNVVKMAFKQGNKNNFPTPVDILAIIAIESSFNKCAISKSNAIGLMQILYKPTSFDIRSNISDGVWLLKDYKTKLPPEAVIQAYNVGIGNYKSGMRNHIYLTKFNLTKQYLERI